MIFWIRVWTQVGAHLVIVASLAAALMAVVNLVSAVVAPLVGHPFDGAAAAASLGAWLVCDLFLVAAWAILRNDQKADETG